MRTPLLIVVALLAVAGSTAHAVPEEVAHQGRLFDSGGAPLVGVHTVAFSLYQDPAGGSPVWTEAQGVDFTEGYFAAQLGLSEVLDASVFDGSLLWLAIGVDGGPEGDRLPVGSVPYAIRSTAADTADVAVSVMGGAVDATSLSIGGTLVVDNSGQISWNNLVDVPTFPDEDSLADLLASCVDGEVVTRVGGAWQCAPMEIDGSQVVSGVLDVARLPVGDTAGTVASGAHTHDAADVASGVLDIARLPVGSSAIQVAAGDHGHVAADFGPDMVASVECTADGARPAWDAAAGAWGCELPVGARYPDSPKLYAGFHGDACRSNAGTNGAAIEFPFNFDVAPVLLTMVDVTMDANGGNWVRVERRGRNRAYLRCEGLSEGLHVLAIEPGVHTIDGKMVQAGVATGVSDNTNVIFSTLFPAEPAVFLQSAGTNNHAQVVQDPAVGGFRVDVANDGQPLHWVAFEPGHYDYGPYSFDVGEFDSLGSTSTHVFPNTMKTLPLAFLQLQDSDDNNGDGAYVELRELTETQLRINGSVAGYDKMYFLLIDVEK